MPTSQECAHPGFGPARNHSPAELTQILWERDSLRWRDQIRAMGAFKHTRETRMRIYDVTNAVVIGYSGTQ